MENVNIICVDDEKVVLTALKSQLSRNFDNNYNIEIAESAEEALEIIDEIFQEEEIIPVIIADQIMPGMKGDEFLIKTHNNYPKINKILLTGQADANAVGNAVNKAKLYRYIAKPWDEADLILTIKEAIRSFFQDKELEEKNAELEELNINLEKKVEERTLELRNKNIILQNQQKQITDSINYAKKIQEAVLPDLNEFAENFADYFVLFKPKDIVSGDFYWFKKIDNYSIVVTADCTGHGVPGAFMSMLGASVLNEIIISADNLIAGQILDSMRIKIKTLLKQQGNINEQKDGMDLALYIIDNKSYKLQFAGAYNPLFIIRKSKLEILKPDKQPIAVYFREKNFTTHNYQLQKNDCLYSFSDGYSDQFGGENNSKFLTKNLKKLLISISDKKMNEQKEILENKFTSWKGNSEQTDDVIIIGVRI